MFQKTVAPFKHVGSNEREFKLSAPPPHHKVHLPHGFENLFGHDVRALAHGDDVAGVGVRQRGHGGVGGELKRRGSDQIVARCELIHRLNTDTFGNQNFSIHSLNCSKPYSRLSKLAGPNRIQLAPPPPSPHRIVFVHSRVGGVVEGALHARRAVWRHLHGVGVHVHPGRRVGTQVERRHI